MARSQPPACLRIPLETKMRGPSNPRSVGVAVAAGLAFAVLAGPAPAKAFDLDCEGDRYRIDLTRKLWCEDACEEVRRVFAVYRREVMLSVFDHVSTTYDRRTRETINGLGALGIDDESRSSCLVLRFSGFPAGAGFTEPRTRRWAGRSVRSLAES